jgi:argininosuccinate synthase
MNICPIDVGAHSTRKVLLFSGGLVTPIAIYWLPDQGSFWQDFHKSCDGGSTCNAQHSMKTVQTKGWNRFFLQ